MEHKKVSIVMCTYNGEQYLKAQLDSLLNQTYPLSEIIIQDDLSTDHTINIIQDYQKAYPHTIRLFQNQIRLGYNRNFLSAFQRATGDYIASADQDDIWEANKIDVLVKEMDNAMLIFHNSVLFNQSCPDMGLLHKKNWGEYPHPMSVLINPKAYGHQLLFHRDMLPLIKQFENYNVSYDSLVYTLCSSVGNVKYLQQILVHWRRHETATTFTGKRVNKNRLYGYYTALKSLNDSSKRKITRDYFQLCQQVHFNYAANNKLVTYMKSGTLFGIMRAGLLCAKNRQVLFPQKEKGIPRGIKSFFLPLFFIRDYGLGIIRS